MRSMEFAPTMVDRLAVAVLKGAKFPVHGMVGLSMCVMGTYQSNSELKHPTYATKVEDGEVWIDIGKNS